MEINNTSTKRTLLGLPALALVLGLATSAVHAQTYINSNTTVNTTINSNLYVGASGQGGITNPVVNIVSPAIVANNTVAYNTSTINMQSGQSYSLISVDSSIVNMTGGTVGQLVSILNGTANLIGGTVYDRVDSLGGICNIYGGNSPFGGFNVVARSTGTVNVFGGNAGGYDVDDNGTINFFGYGLTSTLVSSSGLYVLGGTLSDGTSLSGHHLIVSYRSGATPSFTLNNLSAPEPTTIALLSFGGLGALARRRKAGK
jgi:hypothetical protein